MRKLDPLEMSPDECRSWLHHWNKYHNPDGFMGGQFYLGTDCCNCPFADAERKAAKLERENA